MARNTSVSLTDHFAEFIDQQVVTGNFETPSDVVRAGLSLLEEHQAKVKALQDALREGEESGEPIPFDRDAFLLKLQARHAKSGD